MTKEQEDKINSMSDKVDKMHELLVGNPQYKRKGMVEEVHELKKFMYQIINLKWYGLGAVGVISLAYAIVAAVKNIMK